MNSSVLLERPVRIELTAFCSGGKRGNTCPLFYSSRMGCKRALHSGVRSIIRTHLLDGKNGVVLVGAA